VDENWGLVGPMTRMRETPGQKRRKLRRILLVALAIPVILALAAVAFLLFSDLDRFREPIERWASEAVGRELSINGPFALDLLPSPRLVAEDITLAGVEWGGEPFMARVDHLRLEVGLWSLLTRPVRVTDLEIRGARIHLERDTGGRASWDFDLDDRKVEAAARVPRDPPVLWEKIRADDVVLIYHNASRERPTRLAIDRLDAGLDEQGLFVVDLEGDFGRIELSVRGRVDEVAALRGDDLELNANGPDIAAITDFFGLPSLGSGPFRLHGSAEPTAAGVDLSLTADLVELRIDAQGRVDSLIDPQDTELGWNVAGVNLHAAGELMGWTRLPEGPFEASGRLSGNGVRTTLDRLQLRVGDNRLTVEGVLRTGLSFVDRDLTFEMIGPDLSAFSSLAGARLPTRPYNLTGQLIRHVERIEIARLVGKLGRIDLDATGVIDEDFRLARGEFEFHVSGPDLVALEPLTGGVVPAGPFELRGDLATEPSRLSLREVVGQVGNTAFGVDGELALVGGLVGTDLRVRVAGPDPSWLTPLLATEQLPAEPYEFAGRLRVGKDGYDLDAITGFFGSVTFDFDGHLGPPPSFDSSDLQIRVSGSDLSWLASLGGAKEMPAEPFTLTGRVRKPGVGYELEAVRASVGDVDLIASGVLGDLPRIDGSDLEFDIRGPDLSALSRYPKLPSMPAERFAVSGRVRAESGTYRLEQISGELGRHGFTMDGRLVPEAGFPGSDFELQLSGPDLEDAARIARASGLPTLPSLPAVEYSLDGSVRVEESGYQIEHLIARVADAEARIQGKLGSLPRAVGTDLSIAVHGSDASILPLIEDKPLPTDGPFEFAAQFDGSSEHFAMREFHARLGKSDVAGSLELDRRGDRPHLRGEFTSERLELIELMAEGESHDDDDVVDESGLLLSDEPLELEWLDRFDADVVWKLGAVAHRWGSLGSVELDLRIAEGRLHLERSRAAGQAGRYTLTLEVAPTDDGYHVEVGGRAEQARLGLFPYSGDPSEIAPMELEFQLAGSGRSLHAMAASADGRIRIVQGAGKIDNSTLTRMGADVLSKLYGILNPFMKQEPFTTLECSVFLVEIEDGIARLGPLATRTDKTVMVGGGTVDLETEKLSLSWVTKPRKGIGLSTSVITDNYVKLGGSLHEPRLAISPLKAVRATWATVFTGGLNVVARTVFNRISAERNVCRLALETAEKREQKRGRIQERQ
jgi:uncharacterized protein involved in outer membrane biogenesis